jgi:hypothetical protein
MTEDELEDVAEAADDLGKRIVEALAEETDRDPANFEVDEEMEFPKPDD